LSERVSRHGGNSRGRHLCAGEEEGALLTSLFPSLAGTAALWLPSQLPSPCPGHKPQGLGWKDTLSCLCNASGGGLALFLGKKFSRQGHTFSARGRAVTAQTGLFLGGEKRKLAQKKTGGCNSWTLGCNWKAWLCVLGDLSSTLQLGALAFPHEMHPVFSQQEGWVTLAMKKLRTETVGNDWGFYF